MIVESRGLTSNSFHLSCNMAYCLRASSFRLFRLAKFNLILLNSVMRQKPRKPIGCPRLSYIALVLLLLFVSAPAMAEQLLVQSGQMIELAESKSTAENNQSVTKQIEFPKIEAEIGLSAGYREDEFDWNIAGNSNGNNPNVLSELTWDDLQIFQIGVRAKTVIGRGFYLRGKFDYGWILDGDNQDSDFAGDDRTLEWSRSNNNADDDDVLDASLGIGYQFRLAKDKCRVTPLVGYSYHEQNLRLTDGVQTVSEPGLAPPGVTPPPLGPFAGLDSKYEAEWKGPWVGLDVSVRPTEKLTMTATFEYHWADYEAKAKWNLRTDLDQPKSFTHDADGEGVVASLGLAYAVVKKCSLNLTFDYQDWSTDPGTDKTFFADGTTAKTRLNEVNWESYAVMLGVSYRF